MFNYTETMERLMQQEIDSGRVNGVSALVMHRNKEIFYKELGYADKENQIPMKRDTIIRLFSMSKPITAAAIMLLAERGEIDLQEPVSQYLPFFGNQKVRTAGGTLVAAERQSTIWDMLNMTSGIPYPNEETESGRQMDVLFRELIKRREAGEYINTQEYLKRIAEIPLVFQPGEKWMYGLSADVIGGVIEAVTGKTYGEFLREELFEPLKMSDTGFCVPEEKRHRFAQNYKWNEDCGCLKPFTRSHLGEYYGEDVAFESGGAGLVSTLDDYMRFAGMLLHKGEFEGRQILGRKTVEFMAQNHLTKEQKVDYVWDSVKGYGYGCLMRVLENQGQAGNIGSVGEYGWDGWTGNYVMINPKEEMIFLYFIQRCDAGTTTAARKLRTATYAYLR